MKEMEFDEGEILELPTYSIKNVAVGTSLTVQAISEISEKPEFDKDTGKPVMDEKTGEQKVLHLLNVRDTGGVEGQMLLPFVINKALSGAGTLTGRWFRMKKVKAETGKATHWDVRELIPRTAKAKPAHKAEGDEAKA